MCMNERIKVLHIISGMGGGGAESFLMNMYRHMDHTRIQFDFLLSSDENIYKDELAQYGSEIFRVVKYTHNPIKNAVETAIFFQKHWYPIVHVHANSLMNISPLVFAKSANIPCRIMHSHSTRVIHKVFYPIHWINKRIINNLATVRFSCSQEAGKWMFPGDFEQIKNAIDISAFEYNPDARLSIRKSLGIDEDTLVIGHVGRFFPAKNHSFILDVFETLLQFNSNARLLLVGDGGLESTVHQWVSQRRMNGKVIFLGARKDINKVYNSFDAFIFPSIYEGLPFALIEAQANGLQVFCSTCISEEATITPCAHRIPLDRGAEYWAKEILTANLDRQNWMDKIADSGFDINIEAKKLQNFYLSQASRR